ncbi:hypothetical protein RSAG_01958 [Ruminococcus sp. 5_1_39BFAA]|nr:hypothetical protein RSAG_01958 [Ruminococcus sp. 5_1_39BFAA]
MKRKNFSERLATYNILIISVILFVVFGIFLLYYITAQKNDQMNSMKNILEQSETTIEASINSLDTIALQVSLNPDVIDIMKQAENDSYDKFFENNIIEAERVNEILWSFILDQENISGISIFDKKGSFVYAGQETDTEQFRYSRDEDFFESLENEFDKPRVYNMFENETNRSVVTGYKAVTIIRQIKSDDITPYCIGYVEVGIDVQQLENKLQQDFSGSVLVLYDAETGRVMGSTIPQLIENTNTNYEDFLKDQNLDNYFWVQGSTFHNQVGIIVLHSRDELNRFVFFTVIFTLGIYITILSIYFLIQRKLSLFLAEPLVQLCESITRRMKYKNNCEIIDNREFNEIEELQETFNQMFLKLDDSMKREIAAKTERLKVQLYALQAQIHPHFIHNTIAIIQAYALEEDYNTIVEICENFSDLIRYGVEVTEDKSLVRDELEWAVKYLWIFHLKYGDNLIFTVEKRNAVENIHIPHFIIQPLVENSIKHGLKATEFPWKLQIICNTDHKTWQIEIRDNGVGFSDEMRMELMQYKQKLMGEGIKNDAWREESKIGGMGMKNIITRLYLSYGCDMIFDIERQLGHGAVITVGGRCDD